MLRNIRTRFFGHGLGFLVSIAWPFCHIGVLLLIFTWTDRAPPYGESMALFFATGLAPFMVITYLARWSMISMITNRPLLALPRIKILDLVLAGTILEVLASCCMIIVLVVVLAGFGIDTSPRDPIDAAYAFGAALLLGFGLGIINSILALITYTWVTVYLLATIVLYITSGILFVADALPESLRYWLSFNPTLQIVEWMRSAYYYNYGSTLDRVYTLAWCLGTILLGLLMERLLRGRLLQGR